VTPLQVIGIGAQGVGLTISANTISGCISTDPATGFGIYVDGVTHSVAITGNVITQCSFGLVSFAGEGPVNMVVSGNQISGATTGTYSTGMVLSTDPTGSNFSLTGNVISGCHTSTSGGYGLVTGVNDLYLSGNLFTGNDLDIYPQSDQIIRSTGDAFSTASSGPLIVAVDSNNIAGGGTQQRGRGSGEPLVGSWNVGDVVYNTSPAVGYPVGWVCTTSGTPGTWNPFGAITT
jgi:hypothetical protein